MHDGLIIVSGYLLAAATLAYTVYWARSKMKDPLPDQVHSPVRSIRPGPVPRWEVESHLARLRVRLAHLYPQEAGKLAKVFDSTDVVFFAPDDPVLQARSWGIYRGGQLVRVAPGTGWRGRLCVALAHAFRLRMRGDGDALCKDHTWFASFTVPTQEAADAPKP